MKCETQTCLNVLRMNDFLKMLCCILFSLNIVEHIFQLDCMLFDSFYLSIRNCILVTMRLRVNWDEILYQI